MIFTGRNIEKGFPNNLKRVVSFLNEKAESGDFVFCDDPAYWEKQEKIIKPLGLNHEGDGLYFAVSVAYLANQSDGSIVFPSDVNIWRWGWALHLVVGVSEWKPSFMKRVILSFEGQKENIEDVLKWAAHAYGCAYFDDAIELMSMLPQYRQDILSGLMENDFDRYCELFPPTNNSDEFACVFLRAALKPEIVVKAFDATDVFALFSSPDAMSFLLKAYSGLEGARKEKCVEKVRDLMKTQSARDYVSPVTNWIQRLLELPPFAEECILLLVERLGENDEGHLQVIDKALSLQETTKDFLIRLAEVVVNHFSPLALLKMQDLIRKLYEDRDVFLQFVLTFVLHPKGLYRFVGRKLWDEYHLEQFEFNPTELEEIVQLIFVYSMLQDYGNPETRLPKVLLMMNSDSEKVRGFLMNCLLPYVDEYMGHVTSALDKLGMDCEEANVIRQYVRKRADIICARRKLKELMPSTVYDKAYREAMRTQREHLQEEMKKAEENHKPLWKEFMTTVMLARGNGWRDANGKINHLVQTGFSMPARQLAQSMSPKEYKEWFNQLLKDWDDTAGNS